MNTAAHSVLNLDSLIENTTGNSAFAVVALRNAGVLGRQYGLAFASAAQLAFGERVRGLLRQNDRMLPLASDRICVVFDALMDDNHVLLAGLKLERAFAEPFTRDDTSASLDVNAGLVYYGTRERISNLSVDDLYRFAEKALGTAIERNVCFEVSSEEALARFQQDWEVNHELGKALEAHEISLDYQPRYRLSDGELVGAEAIVRWRRGGQITPPAEFMLTLDESRLWDLTLYCLRLAVRDMSECETSLPIAIPVDGRVLQHADFLGAFQREMAIWAIAPGRLAVEIRESRFDDQRTLGVIDELRHLGVAVIMDQFGRGQASLEKFRDLPMDGIKIDRSFITNLVENEQDRELAEAIIQLAHRFSKTVVADGVEDGDTFQFLASAGCDIGQGFYLGAPLNHQQFAQLAG